MSPTASERRTLVAAAPPPPCKPYRAAPPATPSSRHPERPRPRRLWHIRATGTRRVDRAPPTARVPYHPAITALPTNPAPAPTPTRPLRRVVHMTATVVGARAASGRNSWQRSTNRTPCAPPNTTLAGSLAGMHPPEGAAPLSGYVRSPRPSGENGTRQSSAKCRCSIRGPAQCAAGRRPLAWWQPTAGTSAAACARVRR